MPEVGKSVRLNGNIHITYAILKLEVASAAEAELGSLFLNTREATIIRLILHELGHPQPPTPIHVDNTTAVGIVDSTIKRQRSRAFKMPYFWLLDQEVKEYISNSNIFWDRKIFAIIPPSITQAQYISM